MIDKAKWLRKCIAILSGLLLLIYGIMSFLSLNFSRPIDIILPLYYLVFSLFILDVELNFKKFSKWFKLIQSLRGRGIFYFFIGTLCIRGHSILGIVLSVLLLLQGLYYFYLSFRPSKRETPNKSEEVKSEVNK